MKRTKNTKLVEKRKAIKKGSLILGIDIGSKFHAVVFQNRDGELLKAHEKIYNSRKGFDFLDKEIMRAMKKHKLKKVHVGFEPTGYYWKNLIYHLANNGHEIHFVRTTAVKSQRELDDSSSSKCDIEDANDIASLIREGKYIDSKVQYGVFKNLRDLGKLRAKVMKMKTAMVGRLTMLVNMYFPELLECFWATDSVGFWKMLKLAPFPEDVKKISEFEIYKELSLPGVRKKRLKEQVKTIKDAYKNRK